MTRPLHPAHLLADVLALPGLRPAPAQVWRSVRLVPLLREPTAQRQDLRLGLTPYEEPLGVVHQKRSAYFSVIPHGMIVSWTKDSEPVATWETTLKAAGAGSKEAPLVPGLLGAMHRQVKQVKGHKNTVRFLPLHLAMEGFLSLCIGGPNILHEYYAQQVIRQGLSPRIEYSVAGHQVPELIEALGIFEVVEDQCGVVLMCGDTLASVFVVPTAKDYRALHLSLIQDFFAPTLLWAADVYPEVPAFGFEFDEGVPLDSLEQIHRQWELHMLRRGQFELTMATSLLERQITMQHVYDLGPFTLERFMTDFSDVRSVHDHIGELIRSEDGAIQYLKTYRLDREQASKGALLTELASCGWDLVEMAKGQGVTPVRMVQKFQQAGLGHMFKQGARDGGMWT